MKTLKKQEINFRQIRGFLHHKLIIEFVETKLGADYRALVRNFDTMRRKRNQAIYEPISTISETEAEAAILTARKYLKIIKQTIENNDPQQRIDF